MGATVVLGYVDGKTIVVDRRSANGDFARLPALAAEIVKNRPNVIGSRPILMGMAPS